MYFDVRGMFFKELLINMLSIECYFETQSVNNAAAYVQKQLGNRMLQIILGRICINTKLFMWLVMTCDRISCCIILKIFFALYYLLLYCLDCTMHSSALFQATLIYVVFHCPRDKVYHKQELRFIVFTRSDCHLTV